LPYFEACSGDERTYGIYVVEYIEEEGTRVPPRIHNKLLSSIGKGLKRDISHEERT